MIPFLTYAVRFHAEKIAALSAHWEHHKPLCINGIICIKASEYHDDVREFVGRSGLHVCFEPPEAHENDFDRNIRILELEGNQLPGEWFLTLDSDEYIPAHAFKDLALAVHECGKNQWHWVKGWLCDRTAPGGLLTADPPDYSYATLSRCFPVMADVVKKIRGGCTLKCIASRKPHIGWLHHGVGDSHPSWTRIDHFKWFGGCLDENKKRRTMVFGSENRRFVEHYEENGRISVEHHLCDMWGSIPGWFVHWDVYKRGAEHCLKSNGPVMVELGVGYGKSSVFLLLYALAIGISPRLHLVDDFRGERPGRFDPQLLPDSSRLPLAVSHLFKLGLSDYANFLQTDEIAAAETFAERSCDFVFVATERGEEEMEGILRKWLTRVKPGGMMAGRHHFPAGVKAVKTVFGEGVVLLDGGKSWMAVVP